MSAKKKTVVGNVTKRLAIAMVLINAVVITVICLFAREKMTQSEEKYLLEVVDNITSTVETTMSQYTLVAEVLAENQTFIDVLADSSKSKPMEQHPQIDLVLEEMTRVVSRFGGAVERVALVSKEQDSYIMHNGEVSTQSSLADRPYFSAITKSTTVVTDPYVHSSTGNIVVSVATPLFSGNTVVGCLVLNIPTLFVSQLISEFGDTGNTWVVDSNNDVIAHTTASYIGGSYTAVGVTGDEFTAEMSNPTGKLIEYQRDGNARVGSVGSIPSLGWKMIAGVNYHEFRTASYELSLALIVILIISVVITLVVCAMAVYQSLQPLKELNASMLEMSKGNLQDLPTFESNDEIGELCENLRTTMSNLAVYITEINENLSSFGQGDFTRESELVFLGDFREIQLSTDKFVNLITNTLNSLKLTVEEVNSGSDQVASGSQHLASGSSKQSKSIADMNTFIQDITQQIQGNAVNVSEVNKTAQNISNQLGNSNEKMDTMMEAMGDIRVKSESINKIVKTIEDVAFQTNILALNAAVEAARAGTAGKGFAVVADEVRTLSARTSEAVQNTTLLISETADAVKRGNTIATNTVDDLKQVTHEINGFISTLDEISVASQEQAVAIEKINAGVKEISKVMQSNSEVSEVSAATSEELSTQAADMKNAIAQFKLHGGMR